MSRYEFEPGSGNRVLLNTEGITDPLMAEIRETELLAVAHKASFDWVTANTRFTAAIVRDMHRRWLGDLYPTAGKLRVVNVSKSDFLFCPAINVPTEMERFERDELKSHTPCNPRNPTTWQVAVSVAVVHSELLLIHPFCDGKGRLGRWLADLMCLQSGYSAPVYDLDEDVKREEYYAAMRTAYSGELSSLTALFSDWLDAAQ